MVSSDVLLTFLLFGPTLGALFVAFMESRAESAIRFVGSLTTLVTLLVSVAVAWKYVSVTEVPVGQTPLYVQWDWIPTWNIHYTLGVDGISLPLIVLTTLTSFLAMLASQNIRTHVKGYVILFLLLETGMLGVFLALDFFLFYVFWEVMLLPMYFLIGLWGGPRRAYAAIKFFLYTLFGGVLMLVALLMVYFNSGNSFDLLNLAAIGQGQVPEWRFERGLQIAIFVLLFINFAIKLPAIPFHTWLPDAHVEAPTPVSMLLAGVLLKMGGYGILRIGFPLCPLAVEVFAPVIVILGVVGILYGALAALAQTDFKRLVAYSSISHMGYVLLGLGVYRVAADVEPSTKFWQLGINAAMFQMVAHGISSAGLFFVVGLLYERVHHRDLAQFGGIARKLPRSSALAMVLFFASLGLPGLCGFIGEVFAVLSTWSFDPVLAVLAALGTILTAAYVLWTLQRVYLGDDYHGPHAEGLVPDRPRELFIAGTLVALAVVLGIFPNLVFQVTDPAVGTLVKDMDEACRQELELAQRP